MYASKTGSNFNQLKDWDTRRKEGQRQGTEYIQKVALLSYIMLKIKSNNMKGA